ncbi:group 3 RNA polymerase sigma factor SigF [Microcystis aeruginosa NIES-3787]|uniref:Group 3 RNA polymerase sigma factor SigF n=2 Tax=Microcystis aeruginosa TaxID=1126 RepID=A0A6H9GDE3_MICAE|nr:group 3 RNA polymerase sigma factor SigF [Microcystis aeruginosa NIES-3787]GCL56916.1 group 3 RNA polymerase sigma factor SigF [Microcystis aeruginosa NIES-3807]
MSILNQENPQLKTLSLFQKYQKTGDNKLYYRIKVEASTLSVTTKEKRY